MRQTVVFSFSFLIIALFGFFFIPISLLGLALPSGIQNKLSAFILKQFARLIKDIFVFWVLAGMPEYVGMMQSVFYQMGIDLDDLG